jgi:hypothetical protein
LIVFREGFVPQCGEGSGESGAAFSRVAASGWLRCWLQSLPVGRSARLAADASIRIHLSPRKGRFFFNSEQRCAFFKVSTFGVSDKQKSKFCGITPVFVGRTNLPPFLYRCVAAALCFARRQGGMAYLPPQRKPQKRSHLKTWQLAKRRR